MKNIFLPVFLIIFFPLYMFSQPDISDEEVIRLARIEIDTLCSTTFAGRGYIDDGHKKAAGYLESKFRESGLKAVVPVGKSMSYQQHFPLNINLITGASLIFGKDTIRPGKDFIVSRFSGNGHFSGRMADLGYALTTPSHSLIGKIAVFRDGWPEEIANDPEKQKQYKDLAHATDRIGMLLSYHPQGIIVIQKKLTAGFSREQYPVPVLELKESAVPEKLRSAKLSVSAEMAQITSQNVMGMVEGKIYPDSVFIVCAHYDHLGKLEDAVFTGANDNASGVSMILSMATYFAQPSHQPDYSMLFIAFGGEETGLVGSGYYVNQAPVVPLAKTKFVLNLDLMGNGVDGIMAVGGIDFPDSFGKLVSINDTMKYVPVVRSRKNAPNSDHYFFLEKGIPGFFIYTLGGPPHYHDVNDTPSTIELSKYAEVRALLIRFLTALASGK
ncbi:MAG: M28 family peptidase [Bacteroidia bacterium]